MQKKEAFDWIDENRQRIIEISEAIWRFAEVGLHEYKSSKLQAEELEKHGFRVEMGVAGMPTAFVATWGEGKPVIGYLGEYDALPGLSQKPVPYREPLEEGRPGHGCGHNMLGTALMAAALAAQEAMKKHGIKGTLKYFGCPAEETLVGKAFMARDGVFDGLDVAIAWHGGQSNVASLGSSNAMNSMKFHFHGRAAHGGSDPWHGISAVDAVELMNHGVEVLREHMVPEARIHYVIEDGGHEPNVVPPYARSWYYVRAPEREMVDMLYEKILRIADGADMMVGTTHEVELLTAIYNLLPNRVLVDLVTKNLREVGPPEYTAEELEWARRLSESIPREQKINALKRSERPGWEEFIDVLIDTTTPEPWDEGQVMGGSTEVGDVSWITPTVFFTTATAVLGSPGHSWQIVAAGGMSIGHKGMIYAAKTAAGVTLDLLTHPELIAKAKEEFDRRRGGKVYKCALPPDLKPPLTQLKPM
ncbi:MAG: amidohydrolase [Candidatus Bathyarchaeia archaeon]